MKIHNDVTHSVQTSDKTVKAATVPAKASAPTTSVGSVSISDASRVLSAGSGSVDAPFDTQKVEAIKAAISSGQFKVNPEAVADKVIESASQLLTGKA